MDEAIWALIGDQVAMLAGLVLALAFFISVYVALLEGLRTNRFSVFKKLEGVLRGLDQKK